MNEENINRLNQLESLFAEQDATVETLNTIITRQDREISDLTSRLTQLERLVKSMKESMPVGIDVDAFEQPPHY